jgi:hypothetical protein
LTELDPKGLICTNLVREEQTLWVWAFKFAAFSLLWHIIRYGLLRRNGSVNQVQKQKDNTQAQSTTHSQITISHTAEFIVKKRE